MQHIRDILANAGITPPAEISVNGQIQRFSTNGRKGDKAGYYSFWDHGEGFISGFFGDWRSGFYQTYHSKQGQNLNDADRQKMDKQIRKAKKAAKAIRDEKAKEAARIAKKMLEEAEPAEESHPYLIKKRVAPYGIKQKGNELLIPVMNSKGDVFGLQRIFPNGQKYFFSGTPVTGHFFSIKGEDAYIYICEGFATGASIHKATGVTVICAFNSGNLLSVAKVVRKTKPETEIVIAADNDQWTEGNPGKTKGREAVQAIGGYLICPEFKNIKGEPTDFNDLANLEGMDAVKNQLAKAELYAKDNQPDQNDTEKVLAELAGLNLVAYEQQRQAAAKKLGMRTTVLDSVIKSMRSKSNNELAARDVIVEEVLPWDSSVSGAELLDEIRSIISEHVIMDLNHTIACSLWTVLTYVYDVFRILPLLGVASPEKRCGKTTLLEVLHGLVKSSLLASNISSASFYRVIEAHRPCLLVDEMDTFIKDNDELRGIINSGHTRQSAFVIRTNGETLDPEKFSTWAPKVVSMIGYLHGTISDRSIRIRMKRKAPGETSKRITLDFYGEKESIRRKCERWGQDNIERLKNAHPKIPPIDNDRGIDNWWPLIAIADVAGDDWPDLTRKAMAEIEDTDSDETILQELLQDIKGIFETLNVDRIASKDLVEALIEIEDHPWNDLRRGKPIAQNALARLLKPFGIHSHTVRFDDKTSKGYKIDQFTDTFKRYLFSSLYPHTPHPPISKRNNVTSGVSIDSTAFSKGNKENNVTFSKQRNPLADKGCYDVTVQNGVEGGQREKKANNDDIVTLWEVENAGI